jgi:hypothetical protein
LETIANGQVETVAADAVWGEVVSEDPQSFDLLKGERWVSGDSLLEMLIPQQT